MNLPLELQEKITRELPGHSIVYLWQGKNKNYHLVVRYNEKLMFVNLWFSASEGYPMLSVVKEIDIQDLLH